jgi:hypothetical protein
MKNLVQLYFENGKKLPFVARRNTWNEQYGILVTAVKPRKTETGWYGTVKGFSLPPLDGSQPNDYWGEVGKPTEIPNSGSYQWSLVDNIPDKWQQIIQEDQG